MQNAKDSFYVALRDRLAALNPERTVFLNGVTRPAVIVAENEHTTSAGLLPEAFYIRWGTVRVAEATHRAPRPLMVLECTISYWTSGSRNNQGVDRGRVLAALDRELLAICSPQQTAKCDYAQTPEAELGTVVFWSRPELRLEPARLLLAGETPEMKLAAGELLTSMPGQQTPPVRLERAATLTVFFYPEESA